MTDETRASFERGDTGDTSDYRRDDPERGDHLPTTPNPANDREKGQQLPTEPDPPTVPTRIDDPRWVDQEQYRL